MRIRHAAPLATLLLLPLLASCGGGDGDDATPAAGGDDVEVQAEQASSAAASGGVAPTGDMTLLVYLAADNDLEPYSLADIAEMESTSGTEGLDIVVLMDRSIEYSEEPAGALGSFTGTRLLHIGPDGIEPLGTPEGKEDLDLSKAETLAWFIEAGLEAYPNDRAGLVVWDHGGGWRGAAADDGTGGGDMAGLDEMEAGIAAGLDALGRDRLDLLGFDACLMASYEVAATMAPHARYLLSSEEIEPGFGWDWSAFEVFTPDMPTTELGSEVLRRYQAAMDAADVGADITLSLVDLDGVAALDAALLGLADDMVADLDEVAASIGSGLASTLAFGRDPDPSKAFHSVDLGVLAGALGSSEPDLAEAADALTAALDDMVLDQVTGPLATDATGLAIYFPPTPDLIEDGYGAIEAAAPWFEFLSAYYTEGQAIPDDQLPSFLDEDKYGEGEFVDGSLSLVDEIAAAGAENISKVTMFYGIPNEDGSQITFYGDEQAEFDGESAGGTYDLTVLQMGDGEDEALAYSSVIFNDGGGFSVTSPLKYYSPAALESGADPQDALLRFTVGPEGDIVDERFYGITASGGTGQLTADPDGLIVPVVAVQSMTDFRMEWLAPEQTALRADLEAITYDFVPLAAGTGIFMELELTDFGGNHDYLFYGDAIPFE